MMATSVVPRTIRILRSGSMKRSIHIGFTSDGHGVKVSCVRLLRKLGSLQPRIDLVRDDLPECDWRRLDGRDFHRSQLVSGVDEGLKREHAVREERVSKCLVCDESSDQDLDAALCHADRLSRPTKGKGNASTSAGARYSSKGLTKRALLRITVARDVHPVINNLRGDRQVVDDDRQGVDGTIRDRDA